MTHAAIDFSAALFPYKPIYIYWARLNKAQHWHYLSHSTGVCRRCRFRSETRNCL